MTAVRARSQQVTDGAQRQREGQLHEDRHQHTPRRPVLPSDRQASATETYGENVRQPWVPREQERGGARDRDEGDAFSDPRQACRPNRSRHQRVRSTATEGAATDRSKTAAKCAAMRVSTSAASTCRASSCASDATPRSAMPQGTIKLKYSRSVLTFRAKPWLVTHREIRTPMAASFFVCPTDGFSAPTHTPVRPSIRPPTIP